MTEIPRIPAAPPPAAPYHPPVVLAGVTHDLAHLDPVTFGTPSDKLKRSIQTWCRFTTHCFTRGLQPGDVGPFMRDEGNRPRVFCPNRYDLSFSLPDAISKLSNPSQYVSEAASERNWLHRAEVSVATNAGPVQYQVFFSVKKGRRLDPFDVELTVESAYAFDPMRVPKVRGRMKIAGLLTAIVEGRKPHTQGARKQ